jgi:hypothetical protein
MTQIRECLPDTGLQMPVAEEALQLYRIVRAACPWINDHTEQDFAHGVLAVGLMFTRAQPRSDVAFSWHLQNANDLLRKHFDVLPITGPALLAAVLAHRVPWRRYDPSIGELTELAGSTLKRSRGGAGGSRFAPASTMSATRFCTASQSTGRAASSSFKPETSVSFGDDETTGGFPSPAGAARIMARRVGPVVGVSSGVRPDGRSL